MKIKKAVVPLELTQEEAQYLAEILWERIGPFADTDTIQYDIWNKLTED